MRVLIIDDDEDLRTLLSHYIASRSGRTPVVDALRPLKRRRFLDADFPLGCYDVLVLDYMLGREAATDWNGCPVQEPRRLPEGAVPDRRRQRIIAVRAMKAGADDYQRKQELTRERLITSLRDLTSDAAQKTLTPDLAARLEGQSIGAQVQIPGIKVLHLIGEGGMSRVYLASRERRRRAAGGEDPAPRDHRRQEGARALHGGILAGRAHPEPPRGAHPRPRHLGASTPYLVMEFFERRRLNKRLGGKALAAARRCGFSAS